MKRASAVGVVCGLLLAIVGLPAVAQPELSATLVSFAPWIQPEQDLTFTVDVTNEGDAPATDLLASLEFRQGVQTRSGLQATFEGVTGVTVAADSLALEGEIPPGATRRFELSKPLDEIGFFNFAQSRAYPTRITVSSGNLPSRPVETYTIFFREEEEIPLRIASVVGLHHSSVGVPEPQRGGDPAISQVTDDVDDLLDALEGGRLDALIEAIEDLPDASVTLAPTGELLDMLSKLSNGYVVVGEDGEPGPIQDGTPMGDFLDRIATLAQRSNVELIATPYSQAYIPALEEARAQAQVATSVASVSETLKAEVAPGWLLPVPGVLDEDSAALMQLAGNRNLILEARSVERPSGILTPESPASLSVRGNPMFALVADERLGERLADDAPLQGVIARQRLLADLSALMLERPAISRVVTLVTPPAWQGDPIVIEGLLQASTGSPWLRGIGVTEAQSAAESPQQARLVNLDDIEDLPAPSDAGYLSLLRDATERLAHYAEIDPDPERLRAFEKRLLIAESAAWWASAATEEVGMRFARGVMKEVADEFSLIRAPSDQTITLTSQTGVIPLSFTSGVDYEVNVVIRLDSTSLVFPGARSCPGSSRASCIPLELQPRSQTVEVEVLAEATGTGVLGVSLLTPRSGVTIDSSRLTIRSTAYNVIGLAITGGAALFIVLWWLVGLFRRRSRSNP